MAFRVFFLFRAALLLPPARLLLPLDGRDPSARDRLLMDIVALHISVGFEPLCGLLDMCGFPLRNF